MATTRRELLEAGASSFGLFFLGGLPGAVAQNIQAAPNENWDSGELAHVLPTSSHDRILIKTSFKRPLEAPPSLQVGDQRVTGQRTDSRGSFWQFHVADLNPGTTYTLSLASFDGRSLCQPWTLSTMPALDQLPSKLRLLVYSCAGGHDIFLSAKTGFKFLPTAVRQSYYSEHSPSHPTHSLQTGTTSTGISLHRKPDPDWAGPKQPWNMPPLIALHLCWVAPTRLLCFARQGSRSRRSTGRFAVRPQSFSCKMTMITLTTMKRPTRLSPFPQTISCCKQHAPRNCSGTLSSCLIRIGHAVFPDQTILDSLRHGLRAFPRALARYVMDGLLRYFSMMCGELLLSRDQLAFSLLPTSRRG